VGAEGCHHLRTGPIQVRTQVLGSLNDFGRSMSSQIFDCRSGRDTENLQRRHDMERLARRANGSLLRQLDCFDVQPNESLPEMSQPLHAIMLANAGITIGEMFDLETLANPPRRSWAAPSSVGGASA
jgi:hypothetical protein